MRVVTVLVLIVVLLIVWDLADARRNNRRNRKNKQENEDENEGENTAVVSSNPKRKKNRNSNNDDNNDVENGRGRQNRPKKNKKKNRNKNSKNKKRKGKIQGRNNGDNAEVNTVDVDEAQVMGVPNVRRPKKNKQNQRINGSRVVNEDKKKSKQERKQARKDARKEARKQAKMEAKAAAKAAKKKEQEMKKAMKKNLKNDFSTITDANNKFAVNFYKKLANEENAGKNIFFSPFSLTDALAMTALASRGETLSELQSVIPVPGLGTGSQVKKFHKLNAVLSGKKEKKAQAGKKGKGLQFRLKVANKLFAKEGLNIDPTFQKNVKKGFGSELQMMDFSGKTEECRKEINDWVDLKTGKTIKELIPSGQLNADTAVMIVNAIYFKAAWKVPFLNRLTTEQDFFLGATDNKIKAQFMSQTEFFNFTENQEKKVKMIELPYANDLLSMYVVLPTERFGLSRLETALTLTDIEAMILSMVRTKVNVKLPKFNATKEVNADDVLKSMGVTTLFSRAADMSGLTNTTNFYVSKIFHKAFISVDERGTTASGATGVSIMPMSMPMQFTADEPFLFFIRHTATKAVLFLGRLSNPES